MLPVPIDRLAHADSLLLSTHTPEPGPASLPVDNPTKPYWLSPEDNPLLNEGSTGELTKEADVVIVGSGISGVCAAYHLSKLARENGEKMSVVMLEAREFCKLSSSCCLISLINF